MVLILSSAIRVCMHMCVGCACLHIQRALCVIALRQGLSLDLELNISDKAGCPVSSKNLPVHAQLRTGVPGTCIHPGFYMGAGHPNSDPHADHFPSLLLSLKKVKIT